MKFTYLATSSASGGPKQLVLWGLSKSIVDHKQFLTEVLSPAEEISVELEAPLELAVR